MQVNSCKILTKSDIMYSVNRSGPDGYMVLDVSNFWKNLFYYVMLSVVYAVIDCGNKLATHL